MIGAYAERKAATLTRLLSRSDYHVATSLSVGLKRPAELAQGLDGLHVLLQR